jgi:LPS export ABC transporter protein LptC
MLKFTGSFFMGRNLSYGIRMLLLTALLLKGCENDIEKVTRLTEGNDYPTLVGNNIEVIFSDSAKVKVQILAPEFRQYNNLERPFLDFPNGVEVYFYDDSLRIESQIKADHAIYYNEEKLWHATGNVVAKKLSNGDQLNTEDLFWDEEKQLIYSNTFTRIQNQDGTFYGKDGFESHQDLNNWQLKGSSGTVNVRDEQE